jgi:mono/diheme cytochrome c family protein
MSNIRPPGPPRAGRPGAALGRLSPLLCAAVLTACASPGPPPGGEVAGLPPPPRLNAAQLRGLEVAVRRCAGCHTVGLDDGGAGDGPAFYKLARRYDPVSLERRFAEVSEHGFDRMPSVPFTRDEARDLLAYFESLQGN